MAAPTYRSSAQFGGSNGTTLTIERPAGAEAGDALVCHFVVEGARSINLPTGGQAWTQLAQTKRADNALTIAWFILPNWDGATTSYSITWGGASTYRSAITAACIGCDPISAHNAVSGENFKENASSKNALVDGLTTTVDECLLISCINNWNGAGATAAAEWTEDKDNLDLQLARKNAAVSKGVQSSVAHTYGTNQVSMTMMVALQPLQEKEVAQPSRLALLGVGR